MGGAVSGIGSLLFGSKGGGLRAEADRISKEAFDYINDIRLPTLEELSIKPSDIQYYQVTGKFTPELLQAVQMDKTLLEDLEQNPQYVRDQLQIVEAKKRRIAEGGLTAEDRARLDEILRETERQNRAQQETIGARLRERGAAGSPVEALMRLRGQGQAADTASEQAFKTAALGAASRLQEEATLADMLGRMSREDLATKEARARAQAERERLNVGLRSQADIANVQARNLAQQQALANQQRIAEQNVALRNMIVQQNIAAQQQALQNQMQKAGMKSAATSSRAEDLRQEAARQSAERGGMIGTIGNLVGQAIGTGVRAGSAAVDGNFVPYIKDVFGVKDYGTSSKSTSPEVLSQAKQITDLVSAPITLAPTMPASFGTQVIQSPALAAPLFSDKNLKKEVKQSKKYVDEMLEKLKPYTFKYKNSKHGKGDRVGIMAQDLERSKMGKMLVKNTPEGKAIDVKNAIGAVMASQARIMEKLKKLEELQKKKGK